MAGHKKISSRRRRKRKLILFIVEIIILAVVIGLLVFCSKVKFNWQPLDQDKVGGNDLTDDTIATLHGYKTIAIFGLDNRTQGVYTTGNSDVIMIMAIDNDTKAVSMVSVYRDTYLNVAAADEENKFRKANAAYALGGPEQAETMLNRNLDLDIDNYISVDFAAVAEAIDILGGVDIEIESEKELQYLNDYIVANNGILDEDADTISSTGEHTLNGVQAVAYARIRYTSGGDFKRAERQRRVFSEMVKKAKQANLSQITELINTVFPDIQTDLSQKDMLTMATAMLGYDISNSGGFPYDRTTKTLGNLGSLVVPCDLETNVIQLHKQLYGTEDYEPSETVLEYSEYIINNTGITADSAVDDEFSDADDFTGTESTGESQPEDSEE